MAEGRLWGDGSRLLRWLVLVVRWRDGVCVLGGVGASELALRRSRLGCRGRVAGVSRVLLVSVFLGARNCAGLCIADWWAVLVSLGGVGIDLPRRAELLS